MPNIPPYTKFLKAIGDQGLTSDANALSAQVERITNYINGLNVIAPTPIISRLNPDTGSAGTVFRIEGINLQGVTRVAIGAVDSIPFNILSSTVIEATITSPVISDRVRVVTDQTQAIGPIFTVPNIIPVLGSLTLSPSILTKGASTTISVDVTDADGIQEIQFFAKGSADDVLIGSTSVPTSGNTYRINYTPQLPGTFVVRAKAIDTRSGFAYSPYSSLIVSAPSLPAADKPTISLDLTNRKLSFLPANPGDIIEQNIDKGGWEPYDGALSIGNGYHIAGVYQARTRGVSGVSSNSATTSSPEIQAVTVVVNNGPTNAQLTAQDGPYYTGTSYALSASATSTTELLKAEFYNGSVNIGNTTIFPYILNYTPTIPGTLNLKARIIDVNGKFIDTLTKVVLVTSPIITPPNTPPTVTLTAPTAQSVVAGTSVAWSINATDSDGTITSREFLVNGSVVGTGTSGNYTFPTVGTFSVAARATDNSNASVTSNSVTITVTPVVVVNNPPTVTSFSVNTNTAQQGVPFTFSAAGTDGDGTVASLKIYEGSTEVGSITGASGSTDITPTIGNHSYTVKAIDNQGLASAVFGTTISVTVTAPSVTYDQILDQDNGPTAYSTVNLSAEPTSVLEFMAADITTGDPSPGTMLVYVNGGLVAQIDFRNDPITIGKNFRFTYQGTLYTGVWTNGDVNF